MYLTVAQAAERLQVSTKTIFRRIADGSLPSHRIGTKTIRIKDDDLNKFMEGKRQGGDA